MIKFVNKEKKRFYYLYVNKDLFSDLVLAIIYGGKNVYRYRTIMCDNVKTISDKVEEISKRRLKRGYVRVN